MNPIETISTLLKIDKNTARFILAGIGLFAAISIVLGFNIDDATAIRVGILLLAFSFIARALAAIPSGGLLYSISGWILVTLLFVFLITSTIGALFNPATGAAPIDTTRDAPAKSWLPGIECIVRPFQSCEKTQDGVAKRGDKQVAVAPIQENNSADTINKQQYTIYVQFAGYQRQTVVKAVQNLRAVGWKVAGGDKGGERLASAAGRSQVLYGNDTAKAAAEQLANDINQTGIRNDVKAVANPSIADGTLEIWIGQ